MKFDRDTKKKHYYTSRALNNLIDKKRLPMLFVGAGISKRYLQDYPNWDDLLLRIASIIGVSEQQVFAMKQAITDKDPHANTCDINKTVASNLTDIFRQKVIDGVLSLDSIFSEEEIAEIKANNVPFAKMLIAKELRQYTLSSNPKYASELRELKKLQNNIGAVVTTNYDTFLEKEVFGNNFTVYSEQSQYYMSDAEGIGEIYKIHGCVNSPSNLIFNKQDYENFDKNLRGVASKILSLAMDYPIIFIGYSLEDKNVLAILQTLIDCLNDKQLAELSQNIIYVSWKPQENRLFENKKLVTYNGRTLQMTNIETDNFFALYKNLQKFVPTERPERVRKYKQMIKDLVMKSNAGQKTLVAVESNLDRLNAENKLIVAFGGTDICSLKGIMGLTIHDMIDDVLAQNHYENDNLDRIALLGYVSNPLFIKTQYVPVFFYIRKTNIAAFLEMPKIKHLYENCVKMEAELLENYKVPVCNFAELMKQLGTTKEYALLKSAVKSYASDTITYDELLVFLRTGKKDYFEDNMTDFRKAVTYADFKIAKSLLATIAEKTPH